MRHGAQLRVLGVLVAATVAASGAVAQDKKDGEASKVKPYDEVITEGAVSDTGLFTVHRVGDKLYYEILPSEMGRDMLWVTQIAATQENHSYAGMPVGDRVVRWELRDEDVLLRDVHYAYRAGADDPINIAVEASSIDPIIRVLPVKAWGKDKAAVVDVTDLFRKGVPEFDAAGAVGAKGLDADRTFIDEVKSFPENIETKVLATFNAEGGGSGPRQSGVTALIHHSMVRLPEKPMTPRREDDRVGYFAVGFTDFSDMTEHEAERVRYITRWRLEKKDPGAEVSDPVEPIVFYVGRGVPEQWKPYVKEGIELWQPAFEAAGFSNAIIGKFAPDPREDPDWDAEDARISSIRWLPSYTENAFGPHIHDPRTGQILEADVRIYHNIMKLVRDWYFVQASPSDERAQKLPMPDELMGELIRFVVAHEVGHSLGLPHNMKASSHYSVAQLRDPDWTKANGTAPSIMDYARFNYVAQPGDGAALLPGVGPYDKFSIEWGYRQFPTDSDEKAELEKIAHRQIEEPMFRFGGGSYVDPTARSEDLASDAVEATRLGLANLSRIADYLVEATCRPGEDYGLLDNMFTQVINQWNREIGHVVAVVGGVEEINLYYGDADKRYFPVSAERQREAVAFLAEHALRTPGIFVRDDIVLRLTPGGVASRVLSAQERVVRSLLSDDRVERMAEHARSQGDGAYTPMKLFGDVTAAVFDPHDDDGANAVYRRNLQQAYVAMLTGRIAGGGGDASALSRWTLEKILVGLESPHAEGLSEMERIHREDLAARIRKALETDDD